MSVPRLSVLVACGTLLLGAAACGARASGSAQTSVDVTATDTECRLARTDIPAGVVAFKITNSGTKVTEFYVYGDGDRVMGEAENIGPGLTQDLRVELSAGNYETACKPGMTGTGIRGPLRVTGAAAAADVDPKLSAASESYQGYVRGQADALVARTREFVVAVRAGDRAGAQARYPVARSYWERIEPVAESFGDLDAKIDGREDDVADGTPFTGFHAIEKALWVTGDLSSAGPLADQLLADVTEVAARANQERLTALQMANGAKELLDEVATEKITGEEERYSHTDLWDVSANVEGAEAVVAALRPVLQDRAPNLLPTLDKRFSEAKAVLAKHRAGEGWKLYAQLSAADLKELSDTINALGEPVSQVAAAVTGR